MSAIVAIIAKLFGTVMFWIYNLVGQNFGITIIIFTILTKIIVFPIFFKQQKTTKAMQEIVPMQDKIKNKYKDDKQKQAEELSKLYKDNNISPFAGCLPAIITSLILISMFYIVKYPLTYMKKLDYNQIHQEAVLLKDKVGIKNPDNYKEVFEKEINIAVNSENDTFKINMMIFGINLGDIPSNNVKTKPYLLIVPILSVIVSWMFNKVVRKYTMNKNIEKKKDTEDMAESMQKNMSVMMPIMSGYIALIMPAALGIYWLFGNVMQILQYYVFEMIENRNKNLLNKGADNNV